MKLHLIFIGNKFVSNTPLREYVLRQIEQGSQFIDSITYFKESDNSLFLYLENELNSGNKIIVITTKKNFATVGKVICTATSDNQILKEGMLIPQKATLYEDRTYLVEHENSVINVIQMEEAQEMPEVLIQSTIVNATVHIFEEDKSSIESMLAPIAQIYEVQFTVIENVDGWFSVEIESNKYGEISNFIAASKKLLPNKLIASSSISNYIIERLSSQGKKVSFAESCTGGLLTYYFTKENGASKILDGSLVTYSNALKENWLAVSHDVLESVGAVSFDTVREMSEGVLNVSNADYALSISGIAGDTGGTPEKPVGTVYIGVRSKEKHKEEHLIFSGDRNYIQHQSVLYAVKMLILLDKETFF